MRSILSACLFSLFFLTACGGDDRSSDNTAVDFAPIKGKKQTKDAVIKEVIDAKETLQWAGRYQGILPCADCEGVSIMLEIKPNMSYTIRSRMLGVDLKDKVTSGTFHWLPDNSSIVLEGKEQFKTFRFFPEYGEFRLPDGRAAQNNEQLQLQKTD